MTRTELMKLANETAKNYNGFHRWQRLRKCSVDYLQLDNCTILRSYWTIAAIYNPKTATVYAFDNYSVTTSQHFRKFAEDMHAVRITKLFRDSTNIIELGLIKYINTFKLNTEEWKRVIEDDFRSYIPNNWT